MFPPEKIGSLWIPDQAQSRVNQGMVKYIGPEVTRVKPGDHIIVTAYAGTLMKLEGEGLVIIVNENQIHAIIEEDIYEIPGLYFKAKDGSYFQANYEQAMTLITRAASETDWFRTSRIKEYHNPKDVAASYVEDGE